jgi:type IX secretion system PorP/SprF family membrane protein
MFVSCGSLLSQGNPYSTVFGHYTVNPALISPAYVGFTGSHHIQMNMRTQWSGFPDAPKDYAIGYHGPVGKTLGVGLQLLSETAGNLNTQRFQMNYAFRYDIKQLKLAAGFSTEFLNYQLAKSVRENYLYQPGDQKVEDAIEGNKLFDASFGLHGTVAEKTSFSLTFSNMVLSRIGAIQSGTPEGNLFRYFILNIGQEIDVSAFNFKLHPSIMAARIKDRPFTIDFNLLGSFVGDKLIAGATYRAGLGGAFGLLLGTNMDVIRLYYSYDVSFQNVQQYHGGTHEVTIAFNMENARKRMARAETKMETGL